ncbi:MAG: putative sulfate/molybdate transporter [Bdellovibrionaceae bacterium]|nr:putative sulfate/molybdate transporter [Pseudobdellovibrionaceae bacterium]
MKFAQNFFGAFADGAILFPLLMTLSLQNGMSLFLLLVSSGLAYLVAGFVFRIPMSVQPLKSIAIAGLAVGASALEIRTAAVLLGCVFVAGLTFDLDSLAKKVPTGLIHGVQTGLGLLLVTQGLRSVWPVGGSFGDGLGNSSVLLCLAISAVMIGLSFKTRAPVLGLGATFGFLISVALHFEPFFEVQSSFLPLSTDIEKFRPFLVFSLVLPQIILTSANSVLATVNVSKRYFGDRASRVTVGRLVTMIGFGNILSGLLGGLPFCHGSGGITAHYNGGARSHVSNYIIGSVLVLASFVVLHFGGTHIVFSPLLLGVLLLSVGALHVSLAAPSWNQGIDEKIQLSLMGLAALATGNMMWVLGAGLAWEFFRQKKLFRKMTTEREAK